MTVLEIAARVEQALDHLYDREPTTAAKVDDMLDELARDPTQSRVRTRRIRAEVRPDLPGTVWGFTVRGQTEDYLITWYALPASVVVATLTRDV